MTAAAGADPSRMLSHAPAPEEAQFERALRPRTFAEYVGQEQAVASLRVSVEAARQRGECVDHTLLYGPPGLGKTTLAGILANEMGTNLVTTAGPAIERGADLMGILTNLAANDVLSCRVLPFERSGDGSFRPPSRYPESALVTVATHDLPTLEGWWTGHDIDLRVDCGITAAADAASQRAERAQDRQRLASAAGLAPDDDGSTPERALAVHAYLARSPSVLLAVQPEDDGAGESDAGDDESSAAESRVQGVDTDRPDRLAVPGRAAHVLERVAEDELADPGQRCADDCEQREQPCRDRHSETER